MSNSKSAEAKKIIETLRSNPSQALVIHYSRQNLMDNESGVATPRVIAIMVKSLDGKQNNCFAIHHEAEKADIILENITDFYDQLEERLLRSFNAFVKSNRECKWIHWDMNDVHFGFEAIKHRYCVMVEEEGKDFQEIPNHNRINLNSLLKDIYGANYEKEPQLENLMKSNNGGVTKTGHLTIEEEATAFKSLGFPIILESLRCKVNFLLDVVDKTMSEKLKVSSKYFVNKLRDFITHPVTATIALILTLLGIILKVVSLVTG
jgi:hypothetical protein